MKIKEGKKHNQKRRKKKKTKQPKNQVLGSPLFVIAGYTLKSAFWDMFWNFGHKQKGWNYHLTKKMRR